jgi:TonB family protein
MKDLSNKKYLQILAIVLALLSQLTFLSLLNWLVEVEKQTSILANKITQKKQKILKLSIKKILNENRQKKQIVNSNAPESKEADKKAKYFSDKNRVTKNEVKARSLGPHQKSSQAGMKKRKHQRPSRPLIAKKRKPPKWKQGSHHDIKNRKLMKLSDLRVPVFGGDNLKTLDLEDLSIGESNHGIKQGANNDYLEDVPLGDLTALNTIEYKYFGFYARIRKRLEQFWGVGLREKTIKLAKTGRGLASNEEFFTGLKIILDPKGNVVKVKVMNSSGNNDLDSAAVESFNKAGPFPNPPKGMISNGRAILEWGFVVKS